MTRISTHVIDTAQGCSAEGLFVALEKHNAKQWDHVDGDAINDLGAGFDQSEASLSAGTYRLTFDTGTYFSANSQRSTLPVVRVVFEVPQDAKNVHIHLALSPFGYTVTVS